MHVTTLIIQVLPSVGVVTEHEARNVALLVGVTLATDFAGHRARIRRWLCNTRSEQRQHFFKKNPSDNRIAPAVGTNV
jgi:hypothetical protein